MPDTPDNLPEPYSPVDPENPRIGTAAGPGRAPGARKPGRKPGRKGARRPASGTHQPVLTVAEKREKIQRKMANEVRRQDFARRCVQLRRLHHGYDEVAQILSVEFGEPISRSRVRRHTLNEIRDVDAIADLRYAELDKLESQAANLRKKLDEMDEQPPAMLDMEAYTKLADTYLKYRERVSKLIGLDAPTQTRIDRAGLPAAGQPLDGGSVHIGADGVTIRMPGSVAAFEDWAALEEKGLTGIAQQVIELEAGDHEEVPLSGLHPGDKAGVTLRPGADGTPQAERRIKSALDALDLLPDRDT